MKFAATLFASAAFAARSASAFAPRAFVPHRAATSLAANVLKLNDPQSELLDQVDVFIFDCDGVIWRVRAISKLNHF